MRTCEQRVQDVLRRRQQYRQRQVIRSRRIAVTAVCGVLVAGLVWQALPRQSADTGVPPVVSPPSNSTPPITVADSYDTIFSYLQAGAKDTHASDDGGWGTAEGNGSAGGTTEGGFVGPGATLSVESRDPQVQYNGYYQRDGRYLYILSNTGLDEEGEVTLSILEMEDGQLKPLSALVLEDSHGEIMGLYVKGDRLFLAKHGETREDIGSCTELRVYDLTDRTAPRLMTTFAQSGGGVDCWQIGDVVYLLSSKMVPMATVSTMIPKTERSAPVGIQPPRMEDCVPQVSNDGQTRYLTPGEIALSDQPGGYAYMVVSGYDMNTLQPISSRAMLTHGGYIHIDNHDLYLWCPMRWVGATPREDYTQIYRFSLDGGVITPAAAGKLQDMGGDYGYLVLSVDTQDGYLRMLMNEIIDTPVEKNGLQRSVQSGIQKLVVFNEQLEEVSRLDDIIGGKAGRWNPTVLFTENTVYVSSSSYVNSPSSDSVDSVLVTVDLTDPAAPVIANRVSLPLVADTLSLYNDTTVLAYGYAIRDSGLGQEAVCMLDIENPSAVKARHLWTAGNYSLHTLSLYFCPRRQMIGIPATRYESNGVGSEITAFPEYWVFTYDPETGFTRQATILKKVWHTIDVDRYVCLANGEEISSYEVDTFAPVATLPLP